MSKFNPIPVGSVFNVNSINENNKKIAEILNDEVLFRKNPVGEPNDMKNDLDMNSKRIYNLPEPVLDHEAARYKDLKDTVSKADSVLNQAIEAKDKAEDARDKAIEAELAAKASEIISSNNVSLSIDILEAAGKGDYHYFKTKAEAVSAGIPEGSFAQVFVDETYFNSNVLYQMDGGTLEFLFDFDSIRKELAEPDNELVGFTQGGAGAANFPMLQKSRQFLTGEDYNFNPDSGDVTEEGQRLYAIARERKKKVYLAAGTHQISGPLDPSGVETEGVFGGYRNNAGTVIQGDGTHHAFEQSSNATSRIGYSLKGIHVTNALSALKMGYCVFAEVSHFSSLNVKQGIIISEPTIYGSLWNVLRQCNIYANEEALVLDGSVVANANLIDTCFFSGGTEMTGVDDYIPAVRVTGTGGYGSLATTFINSEITGPGVGLEINRASATTLLNPYFESKAASILLQGTSGIVRVLGGVFGSVRNEHPSPNSFIWHRSGPAELTIDGPQVYLDQSGNSQDNMSLIHSDAPPSLTVNMPTPPRVSNRVSATDWRLFGDGLPTSLGNINHSDSFIPEITSTSGTPPNIGSGSISGRYSRSGKQVHVDVELSIGAGFSATGYNWLISLPFTSSRRSIGSARIFRTGYGVKSGVCIVNPSSRSLSVYASENPSPVGGGIPWAWQEGDVISLSIDYSV